MVGKNDLLLLDSGGQYVDGTTGMYSTRICYIKRLINIFVFCESERNLMYRWLLVVFLYNLLPCLQTTDVTRTVHMGTPSEYQVNVVRYIVNGI